MAIRQSSRHIETTEDKTTKLVHANRELIQRDLASNRKASNCRFIKSNLAAPTVECEREVLNGCSGVKSVGGYCYRTIAGTGRLSDHARGLALDFMVPRCSVNGDAIRDFLCRNHERLGLKYVIWNSRIYSNASGWDNGRAYTHPSGSNSDTLAHRDHVHVSLYGNGENRGYCESLASKWPDQNERNRLKVPSIWSDSYFICYLYSLNNPLAYQDLNSPENQRRHRDKDSLDEALGRTLKNNGAKNRLADILAEADGTSPSKPSKGKKRA